MEKESEFLNIVEKEPQNNEVEVDFLRHGKTEYTDMGRDLTPEGEEQIRESAEKIAENINIKKEKIVFWSSPARRAQGSEEILKEVLEEKGVEINKDSTINSMRNFEQRNADAVKKIWEEAQEKGFSPEKVYTGKDLSEKENFETQEEVRKRAERVFNSIRLLAIGNNFEGKKLHIIGVSHFEFLNPIIEDIFGLKAENEEHIKYGEDLKIKFSYNPRDKGTAVSAEFRGQKVDNIVFDEEKRKFIVKGK